MIELTDEHREIIRGMWVMAEGWYPAGTLHLVMEPAVGNTPAYVDLYDDDIMIRRWYYHSNNFICMYEKDEFMTFNWQVMNKAVTYALAHGIDHLTLFDGI